MSTPEDELVEKLTLNLEMSDLEARMAVDLIRPIIGQQERRKLIRQIAEVSDAVAFQAGVGGMETAGQIVSVLAKEPQHIERFMREGTELFIDGTLADAGRGCLSFHSMNGEITTPQALREARLVDGLKKSSGAK